MPKLIFILGKNPELSAAEIAAHLKAWGTKFSMIDFQKEFLVLDILSGQAPKIDDLGGTIKIGSLIGEASYTDVQEKSFSIGVENFLPKGKVFCASVYPSSAENHKLHRELSEHFKKEFEKAGCRAAFFNLPKDRSATTHIEAIKQGLSGSGDILFCKSSKGFFYIGKTVSIHNPFEFQKRDVEKAEQRHILSISPRLSKILINMAGPRGRLLDPFCGYGTILQEAALMGLDVRGVDIDKNCIEASRKNMEWLKKEYGKDFPYKLFVCDSRKLATKFDRDSINSVATEPYMGPPLKSKPSIREANRILGELYGLYNGLFKQLYMVVRKAGKVCIVSPRFETQSGSASLDVEKIAAQHGFRRADPLYQTNIDHRYPYVDFEERHKLIREIHVMEKM